MLARLVRTAAGSGVVVGPELDGYVTFADLRRAAEVRGGSGHERVAKLLHEGEESWVPLLADWRSVGAQMVDLAEAAREGAAKLSEAILLPPLVRPHARIFAAGGNFPDHMAAATRATTGQDVSEETFLAEKIEQGLPPWGFMVLPETVVGAGAPVKPPPSAVAIDYEAEVAVVLARGGRFLEPDQITFIGASCFSDFSIRDPGLGLGNGVDRGYLKWTFQKTFQSGTALGPWLTVDDDLSVDALDIQMLVNGEERQRGTTASMIYTFAEIAAHASEYVELLPGDVIASGTPAGTAVESGRAGRFLEHGDEVAVVSQALGTLRNSIVRNR